MSSQHPVFNDVFGTEPFLRHPQRRRSSLLDRWIQDQHIHHDASCSSENIVDLSDSPKRSNAYLAYPDLSRSTRLDRNADVDTLNSYDVVESEDVPADFEDQETPETRTTPRTNRTSKLPASLRNLRLSFRSQSSAVDACEPSPSRSPSRVSIFSRRPHLNPSDACMPTGRSSSRNHVRSSSLSAVNDPGRPEYSLNPISRWRPSVLGHFSSPTPSQVVLPPASDIQYTPSRPSISSTATYTSATGTTSELDSPTSHKLSFIDSIRSRGHPSSVMLKAGVGTVSSLSLWSQPSGTTTSYTSGPYDDSAVGDGQTSSLKGSVNRIPLGPKPNKGKSVLMSTAEDGEEPHTRRIPQDSSRPYVAYSSTSNRGTLPRVALSTLSVQGRHKKKRLIISGVESDEGRKFDGVKRWCESFGEVSQILRMPNGDLHVQFRKAEVADTVCRLRAKVYISGVGSVYLSWTTNNKR